jgi:hypothetical protein
MLANLTAKDPNNSVWQHEFAVSHEAMGTLQRLQGRLDEALVCMKHYARSWSA